MPFVRSDSLQKNFIRVVALQKVNESLCSLNHRIRCYFSVPENYLSSISFTSSGHVKRVYFEFPRPNVRDRSLFVTFFGVFDGITAGEMANIFSEIFWKGECLGDRDSASNLFLPSIFVHFVYWVA